MIYLTLLTSSLASAGVADDFVLRVHLAKIETTCEFHFSKNVEDLPWSHVPPHWVRIVPVASEKTPAEWETDPASIRIVHEIDQVRMHQSSTTLAPLGRLNSLKRRHGELLLGMLGEMKETFFPDFLHQTRKFFREQSPETQHLIEEALALLKTGAGGEVLDVRALIQHKDGRLLQLSSGFLAILPERTAPRGLMVMPYLHSPSHDFLINLHYRAGTLEDFADHYAAIHPVTIEPL